MTFKHETWSSSTTFLLASIGAAVGLGNIWRFPYMAGTNGGGSFVLIYILATVLIALPVLIAETMIGRRGKMSAPISMKTAALEVKASHHWQVVGWLGVIAAFLILSFYSVIGGWVLSYIPHTLLGSMHGANKSFVSLSFETLLKSAWSVSLWHTVFITLTVAIVIGGIKTGLEKALRILMPALLFLLIIILMYALVAGDVQKGVAFLFQNNFSKINSSVILAAIGQAFFSIGVGIGIMFTYGAYLPEKVSLPKACCIIAFADTSVAIIAGLAIFPIVFANNLDPSAGPGLVFVVLPMAFSQMSGGIIIGTIFFLLLAFAALTSAISLLEVPVAWLEEKHKWTRRGSTIAVGLCVWAVGLASALSTNILVGLHPLWFIERFSTTGILDLLDYITGQALLPLGGVLISIFVGWKMSHKTLQEELNVNPTIFKVWYFLVRFVCPTAILGVFFTAWL